MKRVFILALIAIAAGTSVFAAPGSTSTKANEHFTASFSKAKNVTWKADSRFDEVSFELGNEKVNAFYDTDGDLIGTCKDLAFDKLPKEAIETITTRYTFPEYQVQNCIEFTNANDEKKYYVSFNKTNQTMALEITKAGVVSVFSKTKK